MKYLLATIFLVIGMNVSADDAIREIKTSNPFVALHPGAQQKATAEYYEAVEKNVFNGAIPLKYAQLAALSASVAIRCEYCIPAHTAFAKAAGATDEEIKTAVAIAADVSLNSSMLYGSQFDMDTFLKMFE
ncbi:MAG: carboxymuconolactone decarboxylase family protein [Halieaceae bacterium]|nr:carboxymuconolactone decarboxylase family protein [Halieaceae bacterium]